MPSTLLDLQEVTHGPNTLAFARSVLLLTVLPLLLLGHVASGRGDAARHKFDAEFHRHRFLSVADAREWAPRHEARVPQPPAG